MDQEYFDPQSPVLREGGVAMILRSLTGMQGPCPCRPGDHTGHGERASASLGFGVRRPVLLFARIYRWRTAGPKISATTGIKVFP